MNGRDRSGAFWFALGRMFSGRGRGGFGVRGYGKVFEHDRHVSHIVDRGCLTWVKRDDTTTASDLGALVEFLFLFIW